MGIRSPTGIGFDSFLKIVGFLFATIGLLIAYGTLTSIRQLGEVSWLFVSISSLLVCAGLFLILARTT